MKLRNIFDRLLDKIATRIADDISKKIVGGALDEAIKSCDYWIAETRKEKDYSYGKVNLLGLVKMDLQHLKKHGYRYYPVDGRPRDMSFWS